MIQEEINLLRYRNDVLMKLVEVKEEETKENARKLKEAENKASFIDEKIGNEIKEMPSNQFYNIIRNYL